MTEATAKPKSVNITGPIAAPTKGILIDRDPPISSGWCGNDDCEHTTHKARRSAQAAADKRRKK